MATIERVRAANDRTAELLDELERRKSSSSPYQRTISRPNINEGGWLVASTIGLLLGLITGVLIGFAIHP